MSFLAKYDTEAKKIACAVVTEWIGLFDPPPQIDFQQSEVLQALIVSAVRTFDPSDVTQADSGGAA